MNATATVTTAAISPEQAFKELGQITRSLHEAMGELGLTQGLIEIAHEIPDARDRLSHVGKMTEIAATRVLDLIDDAQPQCRSFKAESQSMADKIEEVRKNSGSRAADVDDVMAVAQMFSNEAAQFAETQNAVLGDIMMTQDFQDLSGQVIKKVIAIISQTEQQLLSLLMHSAPNHLEFERPNAELAGPQVPDKALRQDDVDEMLASLGF
jgi:chemotaxis protein CheZ